MKKNKSICVGKCLRFGVGGEDDSKPHVDVGSVIIMLGSHFVKWLTLYSNVSLASVQFYNHRKFSQFIIDVNVKAHTASPK